MGRALALTHVALWFCVRAVLLVVATALADRDHRDATLVGWWTFDDATPQGAVQPRVGTSMGRYDPTVSRLRSLQLPGSNATALRMFGNGSAGFVLARSATDGLNEMSIAMWVNYFWGDTTIVKGHSFAVELYRQFIETEASESGGEWKAYPTQCAYLPPGEWHHIAISFGRGAVTLYVDGRRCASSSDGGGQARVSSTNQLATALPALQGYTETANSYCSDKGGKRIFQLKPSTLSACAFRCNSTACKCFDYNPKGKECRGVDGVSVHESSAGDNAYVKVGSDPSPSPAPSHSGELNFGSWSGMLGEMRIFNGNVSAPQVAQLHSQGAQTYTATQVKLPTTIEITEANRSWTPDEVARVHGQIPAAERGMYQAWLNHAAANSNSSSISAAPWLRRIIWASRNQIGNMVRPAHITAVSELVSGFGVDAFDVSALDDSKVLATGSVVVGDCEDEHVQQLLGLETACPVAGEPEAFSLKLLPSTQCVLLIGGGPSGVLYGAFALLRHLHLARVWTADVLDRTERPSTSIRMLNHWSQWRGASHADLWTPPRIAGRADSMFDWAALRAAAAGHANATKRMTDWCRLLASVGINALAPQDVNYDERDNFLEHLPELRVMGDLVRRFGIKLYWTPNYQLAPIAADALYQSVPDFGGYLLKIGSEAQGGQPDPPTINRIAQTLLRNASGETSGTVVLRGFIYGSHRSYYKCPGGAECTNRIAIPAAYFGQYDGDYLPNVHIAGKYTALDFETIEPINPLDGLLKKTKYGAEVVVGKSFPMSWLGAWQTWLNFDNGRGTKAAAGPNQDRSTSTKLLNKDTIDSMVGVLMMGTDPSWYTQPLNLVNLYGYGRLCWNTSMTKEEIYHEWLGQTFATIQGSSKATTTAAVNKMLVSSEGIATLLGIYHGYRGVWYEFEDDGSFRSPNSVKHVLDHHGIGTVQSAADELFERTGYSQTVQTLYKNHTDPRTEAVLLEFGTFKPTYRLSNGKTLAQDMLDRPKQGAQEAMALATAWQDIEDGVRSMHGGDAYFNQTLTQLQAFVAQATEQSAKIAVAVGKIG